MSELSKILMVISRQGGDLLTTKNHFEQLLNSDKRKDEDLAKMIECAEAIKECADKLVYEVNIIKHLHEKY